MKNFLAALILSLIISGCATACRTLVIEEPGKPFYIALAGDIMAGRKLAPIMKEKGPDFLFEGVRENLSGCPVVFGNIESPLIPIDAQKSIEKNGKKEVYLYSDGRLADAMLSAGFNAVSIANNHILDYGQAGVSYTAQILSARAIDFAGIRKGNLAAANKPIIKTANGVKMGFLCYSMVSSKHFFATPTQWGTIPAVKEVILYDIKKCRKDVDLLFVYIHWGKEYQGVTKSQVKLGREAIDAGADFVFGSHTHMFQDIEKYRGKYIVYGLGNFLFDLEREDAKSSALVKVKVENKKIAGIKLEPVYLENYRPMPMTDTAKVEEFKKAVKLIGVKEKDVY